MYSHLVIFGVLSGLFGNLDFMSRSNGKPSSLGQLLLRLFGLSSIAGVLALALIAPYSLSGGETAVLFTGWVAVWALLSRFHPQRQFWHDAFAGTRLINAQPQQKTEPQITQG